MPGRGADRDCRLLLAVKLTRTAAVTAGPESLLRPESLARLRKLAA